jgi:hypothetical protein
MKLVINRMGSIYTILENIKVDSGELENTTYTMKQILSKEALSVFGIIYKVGCVLKTVLYSYGGNNRCMMTPKGGA